MSIRCRHNLTCQQVDPNSEQRLVTLDDLLFEEKNIPTEKPEESSLINFDFAPNYAKKKFSPNTVLGQKLFGKIPKQKLSFKFTRKN